MRPIFLGICAAFFFAFTFVLNQAMDLAGGSWIWSASLRYIFMIPFLLCIVIANGKLKPLIKEIRDSFWKWLLWSFIGFGLFYGPLCFAAAYSPGWLIAGTWQMTIVSGALLTPFFYETSYAENGPLKIRGKIPIKGLFMSLIILLGIILMQWERAKNVDFTTVLLGSIPVIIASIAYPLGNRKMMDICMGKLDAYQRVLGMTISSLPLWLGLSIYGVFTVGVPSSGQLIQSALVALCSGVVATVLFFKATDMVRGNMQKLASVEATQSMEVLFALIGELIFLSIPAPSLLSWFGMFIVIFGMILHSYSSHKNQSVHKVKQQKAEQSI